MSKSQPLSSDYICSLCGKPWGDDPVGLTEKQYKALVFIHRHIKASGVPPSYEQIMCAMDISSKSGAWRFVHGLVERGALTMRPRKGRSMMVTERGLRTIAGAPPA